MRIIAVVMGEPTSKMRNKEVSEMFDYSFAQYELYNPLKNKIVGKYKVDSGEIEYINVIPKNVPVILKKKGEKNLNITYDTNINNLKAPLKKGDKVGNIILKKDNQTIRKIDLTVDKDIPKISFIELVTRNMKDMIIGNININ